MRSLFTLLILGATLPSAPVLAQDSGDNGSDEGRPAQNKLIYFPYKDIREVLDKPEATAIVPYIEYLRMLDQAGRTLINGRQVPSAITEARYVGDVTGDIVQLKATYKLRAFAKGWSEIPLQFGDAAVGKIESDNKNIVLAGRGKGTYAILVPDAGTYEVTLSVSARVRTSPDGRQFAFKCPTVGITTFDLTVPLADQTIQMTPRLVPLPVEQPEGKTRVRANLGATGQVSVSWNPKQSLKPEMELLTSVKNTLKAHIDEGLLHLDAKLDYQILRGEMDQFQIAVDPRDRILDVSTTNARMRGWRTSEADGQKIVTVELLSPVTSAMSVEVHTERSITFDEPLILGGKSEDGKFIGIHSLDTVRETGILALSRDDELNLAISQPKGVSRIDAKDVPQSAQRANAVYYRFFSPDFRMSVAVKPVEPRLVVTHNATVTLNEDSTELLSQFSYTIERAGVFSLSWKLPENLRVLSISSPIMNSYRVDESSQTLVMSLKEKYQGPLAVSLTAEIEGDTPDGELISIPLPEPVLPNRESRETGSVMLFAPTSVEVTTDTASLTGVQPSPVTSATRGRTKLVAAWTYNRRPVVISVTTLRKPARLTAEQASHVSVAPELVRLTSRITFNVENASLDTFQIAIPEAVASTAEINEAPGQVAIKQKPVSEDADDGFKTVTITTQQEILGSQTFVISYDLPRGEGNEEAVSAVIPLPQVLPALRSETEVEISQYTGETTVEKDRSLALTAEANGTDIESIDLRELEIDPSIAERIESSRSSLALAYRYHEQPVVLTVEAKRAEIQEVVQTVVPRALHELVIGRDSLATYRCRFRIISSERQRLRVDLPGQADAVEVIDSRVDGVQVSLEQSEEEAEAGWVAYYVNVARQGSSNEPFNLSLQFRSPIIESGSQPFVGRGGKFVWRLPSIGDEEGANVAVQQTRVMVWVPERVTLVGQPTNFQVERPDDWPTTLTTRRRRIVDPSEGTAWIGFEPSGTVEFPTDGHTYVYDCLGTSKSLEVSWWEQVFLVWVLSGTLLIVGFVLRKTPWENKLGLLLLIAFAATLYGMNDPHLALQGVLSARIGLLAMVGVWVIHDIFGQPAAAAKPKKKRRKKRKNGNQQKPPAVIPPPGVFEMPASHMQKNTNG